MAYTPVQGPSSQHGDGKWFLHLKEQGLQHMPETSIKEPSSQKKLWSINLASWREQGLQHMADTSVKGPSSQQGDGESVLHLKRTRLATKMPKPPSRNQARNKEMVNYSRISKRRKAATYGPNIYCISREQGLQQIAETTIKGPSSQQGDGQLLLHLNEKKVCNKLPKHPSKDQARNKEMVNYFCISKRTRFATHGSNISQTTRLVTSTWQISLHISKRRRAATNCPNIRQRTRLATRRW